jgi:hypothetical protein
MNAFAHPSGSSTSTSAAGRWPTWAAWDVHQARLFGRCEQATGIAPFGRLVEQVMTTDPYASARRVFWVVDNGSSHRGRRRWSGWRAHGPTCA